MSVVEALVPLSVDYLPTGDHALLMGWATLTSPASPHNEVLAAILCLEDGRPVLAEIGEFKFDYRYDINKGDFIDVSSVESGASDANPDQEAPDHGSPEVP